LDIAGISLEDAIMNARKILEHVVNAVIEREGFEVRRDLLDNIETLGSRDEKPTKRRGNRPPLLSAPIYNALHNLRIYGNEVVHPYEPGTTIRKTVSIRSTDIQIVIAQLLRVVEWFCQEYEKGPQLESLYMSVQGAFGDSDVPPVTPL
jgi:hypothetical protein